MKRLIEHVKLIAPIIIICLIFCGFFFISRTGDLMLTQFYLLYIAIILTGAGIIKYSHRDLAYLESRHIHLDLKVKSYLFIILILITILITVFKVFHISLLTIFYLIIGIFIIELTTLYKAFIQAKEREKNGNNNTHIRS